MTEPQIAVGILSGKEIQFSFPDEFISSGGIAISGIQQAVYRKGKIYWQEKEYDELYDDCHNSLYTGGYRIYTSLNKKKQKKLQTVKIQWTLLIGL